MKLILTLLTLCLLTTLNAQVWHKYMSYEVGLGPALTTTDFQNGGSRHFRINPYTNRPWFARQYGIYTITDEGSPVDYTRFTISAFDINSYFTGFEFMPNQVIALDAYNGLKLFENDVWSSVFSSGYCNGMTLSNDTIYLLRDQLPAIKWSNGSVVSFENFSTLKRILVKNERYWLSNAFGSTALYYHENGVLSYYDVDTCLMMDTKNYDFKFSPHTDTLYVSGNKGLSMLYNNTFFDSIAPDNTTNMPSGKIIDFEFDANNNIWALFGSDFQTPTSIAHYDQPSKTWDAYYDSSNSDLNMISYGSIELDTNGNVWMAGSNYFYILEINELPVWLETLKLENESDFTIYPNPSKDQITISSQNEQKIEKVVVFNSLGEECLAIQNTLTIDISSLKQGIYHIAIFGENNAQLGIQKLIVE